MAQPAGASPTGKVIRVNASHPLHGQPGPDRVAKFALRLARPGLVAVAILALAIQALATMLPLLLVGWHESHDGLRYLALHEQFKEAFRHGIAYPRWLPFLYGGYGYPTFVFYQPGVFYATLAANLLMPDTMAAFTLAIGLMFFGGGIGMFLLAKEFRDTFTAWAVAAWFMLTPYLCVNLYVRGDLSELLSIGLTPWPLFFLARLYRAGQARTATWPWLGLTAAALASIVLAHPFTAMFYYPVFCLVALGWAWLEFDRAQFRRNLTLAAAAVIFAVILSSPYWLSAAQLQGEVQFGAAIDAPRNQVATHVVYPWQLISRYWGFGISQAGRGDTMSFALGLPHLLLAIAGCALAARRRRIYLLYGGLYAGMIFMTMPVSLPIWEQVPGLRYAQFPWRILSVIALTQCLCASGLGEIRNGHPRAYVLGMAGAILLAFGWYAPQFQAVKNPREIRAWVRDFSAERLRRFYVYACDNEFLPVTAQTMITEPRQDRPIATVDRLDCAIAEFADHNPYQIHFQIHAASPLSMTINQLYFPGWRVMVDGGRLPDAELRKNLRPDGRMVIKLPVGDHELRAWYDGPPGWPWRNALVAGILLLYLWFIRHEGRRQAVISD